MTLSKDAFSSPLDDTPGLLSGDAAGVPICGEPRRSKSRTPTRATLAKWCGYASEAEFLKESRQVAARESVRWFATCDKRRGGWVVWREPPTSSAAPLTKDARGKE